MTRVKDLCIGCKHFDRGNWECRQGNYLDGDSSKVTVECECYEEVQECGHVNVDY